jgi:hypothetical protein
MLTEVRTVALFVMPNSVVPATPEEVASVIKSTESAARVRTGNEP